MKNRPNEHSVRRIVLPSGRSIEVVRFQDNEKRSPPLHICPVCESELVQPVVWNEIAGERWELTLECPNCRWTVAGTFGRDQIHELEERLDDGLADLLTDLRRLAHANMADRIDRFAAALQANLIVPEDF